MFAERLTMTARRSGKFRSGALRLCIGGETSPAPALQDRWREASAAELREMA